MVNKISYLCVTHERPQFIPWLLWNFDRQVWPDKELIIVDSSAEVFAREHPNVRIVAAPGANVPTKRNIALAEAAGDAITWLDDDDWRHPDSAGDLAALLDGETAVAGGRVTWFVNLFSEETRRLIMRRGVLFAAMLVETAVARSVAFDEAIEKGTDIIWMDALLESNRFAFSYEAPSLFLCHDRNMGNGAYRHHFNGPLSDPQKVIGRKAWGDTTKQLRQLRGRLSGGFASGD